MAGWLRRVMRLDDAPDPAVEAAKDDEVAKAVSDSHEARDRATRAIAAYRLADDARVRATSVSRKAGERLIDVIEDKQ